MAFKAPYLEGVRNYELEILIICITLPKTQGNYWVNPSYVRVEHAPDINFYGKIIDGVLPPGYSDRASTNSAVI